MSGFAALAGLDVTDAGVQVTLDRRHVGEPPVAHGGVAMTALEAACRQAAGPDSTCLSFKVQLLGPARLGDTIAATASVVRRTRTLAFLDATAWTAGGEIARATAVYSV